MMLLSLSFLALPAQAEISYETLTKLTDKPDHLEGDFKQEKTLKSFDTSLVSLGKFIYKCDQSIQWITLSPVENTLLMTPDKVISKQGENELLAIDANQNPTVKVLSHLFFAIMTADWQSLADYFNVEGETVTDSWHVNLTPNNKSLEQAITKVDLSGDKFLREVTLYDPNGDITHILFKNLKQ